MKRSHLIVAAVSAVLLAGCTSSSDEIKQWMDETKKQTRPFVPKLSEPKTYVPFAYKADKSVDPFNPEKLDVAIAKLRAQNSKGLKPNMDRRREPMEQFPLDSIKMVGVLEKPGAAYAILQVDKLIFQAKTGNYLGQNFGMITSVSEAGIDIKEIVLDASGEWVERKARLELQESKDDKTKTKK